VDTVERI